MRFRIQIKENKNSAKKFGMIKMLMGAVFLAISLIRIRAIMDWQIVAVIFDYTFFFWRDCTTRPWCPSIHSKGIDWR